MKNNCITKILGIILLSLLLNGCGENNKIVGLKKETFSCQGKGGTNKKINVVFDIDPSTKTLTFKAVGMMGKILNYPTRIVYDIKSSDGTKILTKDYTYEWTNLAGKTLRYISYISTNDKNLWEYGFRQTKGYPYTFKNCKKLK